MKNHFAGAFSGFREVTVTDRQTAMRRRPMPFTEEQMKQVFDTNIIDFAVSHGFEVEKGDRNTVHVKHSGGLYLFRHGRGYYQFAGEKRGNIIQFAQEYLGATDFKSTMVSHNTSSEIFPVSVDGGGVQSDAPLNYPVNRRIA